MLAYYFPDRFERHGSSKVQKKAQINAKATGMTTKALFPDRLETLKDDNIRLKSNQKELEQEIKIISTKFKRQIDLLKKERLVSAVKGSGGGITAKFEEDFNGLIEENCRLQMQEQELNEKVKKLNNKRKKELAKGKTLYTTVNQGMEKANQAEREGARILRDLRNTLEMQDGKIKQLVREINNVRNMSTTTLNLDDMYRQRRKVELELMREKGRLEDMKASLKVKSNIFDQGKQFETDLFNQLKQAQNETNSLTLANRTLRASASQSEDVRQRLMEARQDRDKLQSELDQIMRQPFFKKQSDDTGLRQLEDLQKRLEQKEKEIATSKAAILKAEKDLRTIDAEMTHEREKKNRYEDEIAKMKAHLDPTSLTLNDVMKKLQTEDPSRFREVMRDLEYEGRDPAWYAMGQEEVLRHLTGKVGALQEDSIESLKEHKERLMEERFQLVTQMNKIQKQLKINVDMDKQTAAQQQAELAIIQSRIRQQTKRSTELTTMIKTQNEKLLTMQEHRVGTTGLTQADLQRFNQEMDKLKNETKQMDGKEPDAMTEVSTRTDESELGPQENLLDLRITSATFDRVMLTQMLTAGHRDLEPGTIQTFLAVDFFNHDTKSTDITMGLEPIYNTLFSFKNTVDNFYVKYLEKDTILVDFFYVPKSENPGAAAGAVKLGSARLPLVKLLDKDYSF